jgi:hypothetical protein
MLLPEGNGGNSNGTAHGFDVVDSGEYWRVMANPQIRDYLVHKQPWGRVAIGLDPLTRSNSIVWMEYPKSAWTLDDIKGDAGIRKKVQECGICTALNDLQAIGRLAPTTSAPSVSATPPAYSSPSAPTPARASPTPISAGDVVMPRYIPYLTTIGKKMFCTKLGDMSASLVLSLVADVLGGWSTDPGHKMAFRQMSDEFIDDLGLCNEADVDVLKRDVAKLYEEYQKSGDMLGSVRKSMFKNVADSLKDAGIQVDVTKNSTVGYRATARRIGAPSLVD